MSKYIIVTHNRYEPENSNSTEINSDKTPFEALMDYIDESRPVAIDFYRGQVIYKLNMLILPGEETDMFVHSV
jgi:hypothetical protein